MNLEIIEEIINDSIKKLSLGNIPKRNICIKLVTDALIQITLMKDGLEYEINCTYYKASNGIKEHNTFKGIETKIKKSNSVKDLLS